MRTTVTLDRDIAKAVEQLRRKRGIGLSQAINELARLGLSSTRAKPASFTQDESSLGMPRIPLDNIADALDALEGDARR